MSTETSSPRSPSGESTPEAVLRTLLVCDLVESTRLVEKLGDRKAFELFREHDRLARELLARHRGTEIDKTDGFLLLFDRPLHAASFALDYHRALAELSERLGEEVKARVGIHLGEVFLRRNAAEDVARGAKPLEVEGLAKPIAARLAALALPGQTLLTRTAFDLARRATQDSLPVGLQWKDHGQYPLKGVDEPVRVYEVGIEGISPFVPPVRIGTAAERDRRGRWRTGRGLAAALVLILVAAGATATWWWRSRSSPAGEGERERVVLADVVNRTEEPLLDDALDLALRVGFEQSARVSVVPASRVRDALRRMERDPVEPLDRDLAVEVAQREGAGGVVVATVAEVGRRFSLTGEVVDPSTGATRLVATSEADSKDEIVGALGEVIEELRRRLGEAFPEGYEPQPLPAVTTGDLEALKAFALGIHRVDDFDFEQGLPLLERAVEKDPGFAMAHARLGTVYFYNFGNAARADEHWRAALANRERLAERERLYVEGSMAWEGEPEEAIRIWTLMANLYPDDHAASANLGYALWYYRNDFAGAATAFARSVASSGRIPATLRNIHAQGYCEMGQGEFERAVATFDAAWEFSPEPLAGGPADAFLAAGDPAKAREFLERTAGFRKEGIPYYPFERLLRVGLVALEQGDPASALVVFERAATVADEAGFPTLLPRAEMARIAALQSLGRRDELRLRLGQALEETLARLDLPGSRLMSRPVPQVCLLGKVAAREGWLELAERALAAATRTAGEHEPALWQAHLRMLEGEIAMARGQTETAGSLFERGLVKLELYQLHESRRRLALAAGDESVARQEAAWLVAERGRAFSEWIDWFYGRELSIVALREARGAAPATPPHP